MDKYEQIRRDAEAVFSRPDMNWGTFHREMFGENGLVRTAFPDLASLAEFERTEVYQDIQHMLTTLRGKVMGKTLDNEPTKVITVRIPATVHEALKSEALLHKTNMNQLCISKLLLMIDNELIPVPSEEKRTGRQERTAGEEAEGSRREEEVAATGPEAMGEAEGIEAAGIA